jgi:hypothetical protein
LSATSDTLLLLLLVVLLLLKSFCYFYSASFKALLLLILLMQVPGQQIAHLPEPAVQLWQKVLPLGLIFFCASFNLTILQVICTRLWSSS